VLSIPDIQGDRFGEGSQKSYDDLDNGSEVRDLIDSNPARAVDQHVLDCARAHPEQLRTALIFPPIIYGEGRGLGNNKSIQIPGLCRMAVAQHRSVYVGKGQACWGNVHIADLAKLATDLVDASAQSANEHELWNANGLYFPATGEMVSSINPS
jgi:nucleoside-diphosphate-sugar epimerase